MKPKGLKAVRGALSVYQNVHGVRIPLPVDQAYLTGDAEMALHTTLAQVGDAGGRILITSMWRTPEQQMLRWTDFQTGNKRSYSPLPGRSMHECGRAIDIDTRADSLKLPHSKIREILLANRWFPIVELGKPGDGHYEYRDPIDEKAFKDGGYEAMVKQAFEGGKYTPIYYTLGDIPDAGSVSTWT